MKELVVNKQGTSTEVTLMDEVRESGERVKQKKIAFEKKNQPFLTNNIKFGLRKQLMETCE